MDYYLPNSNLDTSLNKICSDIDIVNEEYKLCTLLGYFNLLNFEFHKPTEELVNTTGNRK